MYDFRWITAVLPGPQVLASCLAMCSLSPTLACVLKILSVMLRYSQKTLARESSHSSGTLLKPRKECIFLITYINLIQCRKILEKKAQFIH